ncbi:MAG: vitamin K epoxide reductase family protein [Thaumarchaeota archaeon]|nr:vitamin K epoxide reductase family protein [Nitrososphaerota archaeon]
MRISRLKLLLLVAMSAFGLWAASEVLIVYYYLHQALPLCTSQPGGWFVFDCNVVLGSSYSQIFGIPLELFAVIYFIVNILLVFTIAFASARSAERSLDILFVWRFLGVLIVPYLVFVELFLLKAICIYCTMMHVAIVLDFIVISYLLYYSKNSLFENPSSVGAGPNEPSKAAV